MPFPYDRYPWLNFQELNLAYFIKHFREIFQQWDELYHDLTEWKEATDQDLADWKAATEAGLESWKTGLTASLETWKSQTASDISGWESATLAALDAWKTATTAVFEEIRVQAAGSASAAAASAASAETARAAAVTAQAAAEQAAQSIQSRAAQIQTNTTDIATVKNALNFNRNATPGFVLRATDSGYGQEWAEVGTPTDEQAERAVSNWLDEHPEATTTVNDDSIDENKLTPALREKVNASEIRNRLNLRFIGRVIRSAPYASAQAFLAREENGTLYIYSCFYNYDTSDEQSIIVKMDTAGNIIAQSEPLALNHSNDMCSDGTYFYVCGYGHDVLYRIDPATLTVVNAIQLQYRIQAITYDPDKNLFYAYSAFSQNRIFAWTPAFSTPEIVGQFAPHYGVETVEYFNGTLFMCENAPNSLTAISTETWQPLAVTSFADFMSDYYPIGEMQGISIYNDKGDFITVGKPRQKSNITNSYEIGYGISSYGTGNIYDDSAFLMRYESPSVIDYKRAVNIDNNTLVFTPDGTTSAPFYNAGDLIICLDSPYFNPAQINLLSDVPDEFAVFRQEMYIEGGNHTIQRAGLDMCSGLLSNVVIAAGTIRNSRFSLRNVTGAVTFTLCSLDLISGTGPEGTSNTLVHSFNTNAQRIAQVTSGSTTVTFAGARPIMLLFCILDASTVYRETMIVPFGAMGSAAIESGSYRAEMNAAQTQLIVSKTSSVTGDRVRVYAIY